MSRKFKVVLVGEGDVGKSSILRKIADPAFEIIPQPAANQGMSHWMTSSPPTEVTKEVHVGGVAVNMEFLEVPASRGRMSNHHMVVAAAKSADCIVFCFSAADEWSSSSFQYFMKLANQGKQDPARELKKNLLAQGHRLLEQQRTLKTEMEQISNYFLQNQQHRASVIQQLQYFQQHQHQIQQNPLTRDRDFQHYQNLLSMYSQYEHWAQRFGQLQNELDSTNQQLELTQQHYMKISQSSPDPVPPFPTNFYGNQHNSAANFAPQNLDNEISTPVVLFQLKTDQNSQATFGDQLAQQTGKKLVKISAAYNYNVDYALEALATTILESKRKIEDIPVVPTSFNKAPIKKKKGEVIKNHDVPLIA